MIYNNYHGEVYKVKITPSHATVVKFNYGTKISDQDSEALMQL